ncbi:MULTISPECIES: 2-amino-4-hydroxy-6-hydroxymethyldihydropteridine diphosphokinase [Vibrio]|uniref:2-amino-4-hydroxy-6-hydroxymethyldihydropteridine pyrophosphokinase n=1 Tax=Vibrio metschnikovii TaxID=28172 RepID=A0A9X0RA37_VIBME|nr:MULTISPECIES: 2-amino-4-hydroxy-6-hydroxymethyldihydropteridine diphosphokinase [Vibrio]EEX38361.1 2-amino-4-hydroxy-6-hydroxymethyldihydropteridine pyrophosphokinase [Vibrio metschnikovii CIP 69.14]EKO3566054.1 2-amino-4-hydroxy-6-hydroxymethyldihydropteridine diphosphokinase [Vibrio metschnikovii]EKO3707554.1 2-amino-4-hydroxy-6-hydroxymethyldihydropteridine diphosphokinase [Vibrio metschnikovii]EKO3770344.1 2-amino-4-hydroxy-6-hydroxymethyldihydropteridine diphosphokinase [Vibrio metschni
MTIAYIAVGSNLAEPILQAKQAIEALKQLPQSQFIAASSLYSSTPMGPQDQPEYINAVVVIDTQLSPLALLDCTQAIEQEQGRERKAERWGPRTLDLDILLYGDEIIDSPRLTVPHYGMKVREFVLYPLDEIAPDLSLPDGTKLSDLLSEVDRNGLSIWHSPT